MIYMGSRHLEFFPGLPCVITALKAGKEGGQGNRCLRKLLGAEGLHKWGAHSFDMMEPLELVYLPPTRILKRKGP